jgi:pyridoxal phosphate phosphatase PHOSPHO2
MTSTLFIWDFDQSVTEKDTDQHVFSKTNYQAFEKLASPELRLKIKKDQKNKVQWTDMVASFLVTVAKNGLTKDEVVLAFADLPIHSDVRSIFQLAADSHEDSTTIILSDSNQVYIESALKHHELDHFVSEIITNPSFFSEDGVLKVDRLQPRDDPHGCLETCTVNICKSMDLLT